MVNTDPLQDSLEVKPKLKRESNKETRNTET